MLPQKFLQARQDAHWVDQTNSPVQGDCKSNPPCTTREIAPGDSTTQIEFCVKGNEGYRGPIASACLSFYTSLSLYLYIHIYTYIPYSPEGVLKPGVFKRCVKGTVKGIYGERDLLL